MTRRHSSIQGIWKCCTTAWGSLRQRPGRVYSSRQRRRQEISRSWCRILRLRTFGRQRMAHPSFGRWPLTPAHQQRRWHWTLPLMPFSEQMAAWYHLPPAHSAVRQWRHGRAARTSGNRLCTVPRRPRRKFLRKRCSTSRYRMRRHTARAGLTVSWKTESERQWTSWAKAKLARLPWKRS